MMPALELGSSAAGLVVKLNQRKDFICTLTSEDGDWPAEAVIALEFGDDENTVWAATIDGPDASWDMDKAVVDALIERLPSAGPGRVRLSYTEGTTDLPWAQGTVSVTRWRA